MKKVIIICAIIFTLLVWGCYEYINAWSYFSGSYNYAEVYIFDAPEAEVIEAIKKLKQHNPTLQPPSQDSLIYSRAPTIYRTEAVMDDSSMQAYQEYMKKNKYDRFQWKTHQVAVPDYWLDIDFYYQDTQEIVHTWTRPAQDSTKTTFAFVSISPLKDQKTFYLINKDYWYVKNKMALNKFQKQIIERIQEQLRQQ